MLRPLTRVRHARRIERRALQTSTIALLSHQTQTVKSSGSTTPAATSYIPERLRAKNSLRALQDLLPRILEPEALQREPWSERVAQAIDNLSKEPRLPTVASTSLAIPRIFSAENSTGLAFVQSGVPIYRPLEML